MSDYDPSRAFHGKLFGMPQHCKKPLWGSIAHSNGQQNSDYQIRWILCHNHRWTKGYMTGLTLSCLPLLTSNL